eukprot:TRINITY_DN764_c0_g2_i1.p1 TRINITY_DN764_c0_g2~~TRINITY_DN764_c0_g2_i1.p1  ORF type:complete len:867 (-),score=166.74 TRINITY_DN764_c0_g2_i1:1017-3617(-)
MAERPHSVELDSFTAGDAYSQDNASVPYVGARSSLTLALLAKDDASSKKLGTFFGVYFPTVMSILGIVLFLRLPWIVGNYGVLLTWGMYLCGYLIVVLTVLSLSAVATNGRIKGGGAYYMISRALGPEFGGSIGLIFYFAQVVAGAFYFFGYEEAFIGVLPTTYQYSISTQWLSFIIGSATLAILTAMLLFGAKTFARATVFLAFALILSMLAMWGSLLFNHADETPMQFANYTGFTGPSSVTLRGNMLVQFSNNTFSEIFSVLFPSITGIMAGANLSGDLADPASAIPKGTLLACLTTCIIYILAALLYGVSIARSALQNNLLVLQDVVVAPWLLTIAVFCASLSSALGSLIGGSRILQALARDRLLPLGFFAAGRGEQDEPVRALLLTWLLIQGCLFLPGLNVIANYASQFYLMSFCVINFAALMLTITGTPNFRPSWRFFGWPTALAGTLLSLGVMFFLDYVAASVTIGVMILVFGYVNWRAPLVNWGDISQALIYHQVRKYLLRLDPRKEHLKFWRPAILLGISNPRSQLPLIEVMNDLKKGGLFVIGSIVHGNERDSLEQCRRLSQAWTDYIEQTDLKAFADVVPGPSVRQGMQSLMLSSGLGGMRPNTVVFGFNDPADMPTEVTGMDKASVAMKSFPALRSEPGVQIDEYIGMLRDAFSLGKNALVARHFRSFNRGNLKRAIQLKQTLYLDVWPFTEPGESEALLTTSLLLAHILKRADMWRKCAAIRLFTIVENDAAVSAEQARLENLLSLYRIDATAHCIAANKSEVYQRVAATERGATISHLPLFPRLHRDDTCALINEAVSGNCAQTALVFLGLPQPPSNPAQNADYMKQLSTLSHQLPPTLFVYGPDVMMTDQST